MMSTAPRSPKWLKVYSAIVSHPHFREREHLLDDACVTFVQQARDVRGGYAWPQLKWHANGVPDQPKRVYCELIDAGGRLEIELPPTLAHARATNQPADSAIIHEQMFAGPDYR